MSKHTHYKFPIVTAFWCLCISRSWTFGTSLPNYQTHLCLPLPPHLLTFYQHNFLGSFFLRSILKLCLALGREFSTQAALPFAITLIKSASLRSDFGLASFFRRPAARLMTCPRLPLCVPCAAIRHCRQVGSLSAVFSQPAERGGLRGAGREREQQPFRGKNEGEKGIWGIVIGKKGTSERLVGNRTLFFIQFSKLKNNLPPVLFIFCFFHSEAYVLCFKNFFILIGQRVSDILNCHPLCRLSPSLLVRRSVFFFSLLLLFCCPW